MEKLLLGKESGLCLHFLHTSHLTAPYINGLAEEDQNIGGSVGIVSFSWKASSGKVHGGVMEAQENRHKRAREPDMDSDTSSESGLDSSRTTELTSVVEGVKEL